MELAEPGIMRRTGSLKGGLRVPDGRVFVKKTLISTGGSVGVTVGVNVGNAVALGVFDGVFEGTDVALGRGVFEGTGVALGRGVFVASGVEVGRVGVDVGVRVDNGVRLGAFDGVLEGGSVELGRG